MKEIIVISGKGGVGKSSITASLGALLNRKFGLLMADTDVDTPNLALFFAVKLIESKRITASEKAVINYKKCISCFTCQQTCKFSAITGEESPVIISFSCEGCGACTLTCPEDAIAIQSLPNGMLYTYKTEDLFIISGELDIGESSSGHIVDVVKKGAREKAESLHSEIILIDGPPGIGCPVISSIKGGDYVLAVTEPTPAALNDLKRLYEVLLYFKLPFGIVINKSDIHLKSKQTIKDFAKDKEIPILSEIPYDTCIPMAIAKAMPVVTAYPDAQASLTIRSLADKLTDIIKLID